MGRVIAKKIRGMNLWVKVGLVTTLTLLVSVFMYQGWYKPKASQAVVTDTFTTAGTGTWTAPAGVTSVTIECWGGGGAGAQRSTNGNGGGGGGGAYAKVNTFSVTPGNNYSYTVGAAGTSAATPTNGGASSFNATTCVAAGGTSAATNSATGGAGGLASASTGNVKYNGGNGWTATGTGGGGGGSSAGTASAGNNATSSTGATAVTGGGPGGNGRTGSQGAGSPPASGPGGGGGGAYRTGFGTVVGGDGYAGQVRITYAVNMTTAGAATATAGTSSNIAVSMPYTYDENGTNTYTVAYKLSSSSDWTNWVTDAPHVASPYATTITGLAAGQTYDVMVTYDDPDGVNGTNPQTFTGIAVTDTRTVTGMATATAASTTTIAVTMPYLADSNANNTYTVAYKLTSSGTWTNWVTNAAHTASPYTTTITGLTAGTAYDVRMTYNDANGIIGSNNQIVTVGTPFAPATVTFTTAGTANWTAPAGVTSVTVECWGGGGAGAQRTTTGSGGGGGGGAYAMATVVVVPGNSYSYTVGPAGVSGATPTNGGASSFNTTAVVAAGGTSVAQNTATGGAGGLASASTGDVKYDGGSGFTAAGGGGGGGGSGGTSSAGNAATSSTGAAAVAGGGPGGSGRTGTSGAGTAPASGPGGGGGGAYRTTNGTSLGGNGYAGQVTLTYTPGVLATTVGIGTAADGGAGNIDVTMPFVFDDNNNNSYTVEYKLSSSGTWTNWVTNSPHVDSPYVTTIAGLTPGSSYDVRLTWNDPNGVNGTSPQTISGIAVTDKRTIAGTATAVRSSTTTIDVTMPYSNDGNGNNTYTVDYKDSTSDTWTNWVTAAPHTASPYTTTITGLTAGNSYDVRVTYDDPDGVVGANPQTFILGTLAGEASVVSNATSISYTMPYTGDSNGNNSYTVEYKLTSSGTWTNWVTNAPHVTSPYTATITGLTEGLFYDIRLTYNDSDGVSGTNPQTFTDIFTINPLLHNSVTTTNISKSAPYWSPSTPPATVAGWGITGAKYGKFDCTTCHIPGTTNISRIKLTLTPPDATTFPGSAVLFQSKTTKNDAVNPSFGVYSTTITNSKQICEVCHTYTSYHKQNQPLPVVSHENLAKQIDCIECHKHNQGFKAIGGCTICHKYVQRKNPLGTATRTPVMSQFSSGNSHHIQGVEVTDKLCYQCHWEANSDGTVNVKYHGGTLKPNSPVNLVVYQGGARPSIPNSTTFISYSATGTRNDVGKLNKVCLGCHSSANDAATPFGDGKTPKQYAWDDRSIDERYSQTGTTPWGKKSGNNTTPKASVTKAFSAHGNAANNQQGFAHNTLNAATEAWTNSTGSGKVVCYDCHNSHGSKVAGVTSSYSSATGKGRGAILKDTTAGQGGYTVTYKPAAGGSAATKNVYNAGAGICFDCHQTASAGTTPWGYGTYGATKSILGYWDTPYFGAAGGTFPPTQRYTYKAGTAGAKNANAGGHFGASSTLDNPPDAAHQIGGLCTPCHDPHGVTKNTAKVSDQNYAVPLLKGTWVTSFYQEDLAPAATNDKRGGGSKQAILAGGSTPAYKIDQNTLQANKAAVSQNSTDTNLAWTWGTAGSSLNTLTEDQFAGLCTTCHNKSALAPKAGQNTAPDAWKSRSRIHGTVEGWATTASATDANANNAIHAFTCSKCHTPHNYRLPRLMVTNCLDYSHRGKVASGGTVAATRGNNATTNNGNMMSSAYSTGNGAGRFPSGGARYNGTRGIGSNNSSAHYPGPWFFGINMDTNSQTPPTVPPTETSPLSYSTYCHDTANAGRSGDTPTYPASQRWNSKTPW
ncbi:glycine-rich domain-containing protein [Geomobilimonas luticola]|uniref:Fibronectin type III domain-containing protein n=1 Tax=Geomobilimonas luticola TaxID=1114878 RepID=A0ABS5SCF8_9BACT|nr:fibronectin type III domain-containing protein [Geomobilimonas luticola]MBT0652291.1 fibronectin type III domain-containing protein [Geomobilimonas luticola]